MVDTSRSLINHNSSISGLQYPNLSPVQKEVAPGAKASALWMDSIGSFLRATSRRELGDEIRCPPGPLSGQRLESLLVANLEAPAQR
jgi:hypothetical protein